MEDWSRWAAQSVLVYHREVSEMNARPLCLAPWFWTAFERHIEAHRLELRHAVILEGANVPCELVRDGGG